MKVAVLDYSTSSVVIETVPASIENVEDWLVHEKGYRSSQISYMVSDHISVSHND